MTRPSSIFNFSALRLHRRWPLATLAAVALLLACEVAARRAVAHHKLHLDDSARRLIQQHRAAVARGNADVWLLGNSTLGYGVDEKLLARQTGAKLLKLPHGSATVAASARLLEYYLNAAPKPPRQVVLFITKDDLNVNGYRAEVSSEYEALCSDPWRKPQEFLTLWQARSHIAARFEDAFARLLRHRPPPKPHSDADDRFDGKIASDDEMYLRLVRNFKMDEAVIGDLGAIARRHAVANVTLVLVPCTDAYVRFHDSRFPAQPYATIRTQLASLCAKSGVTFADCGEPTDRYAEFFDGYHLNDAGAARFTARLVHDNILIDAAPSAFSGIPVQRSAPLRKSDSETHLPLD